MGTYKICPSESSYRGLCCPVLSTLSYSAAVSVQIVLIRHVFLNFSSSALILFLILLSISVSVVGTVFFRLCCEKEK